MVLDGSTTVSALRRSQHCAKHSRHHPMHIPMVMFAMQDFNTALRLSKQRNAMLQPQLFLQRWVVFLPQRATYNKSTPFHQFQALL